MGYITNSELAIRYPLVNRWVGVGSASIVNSHLIYYAEAEINALLSPYFSVPFSSNVPAIVQDLTLELCKVRIVSDQDADLAEKLRQSVIDRVKLLGEGGSLPGIDGSTIVPSAPGAEIWSNTMNYHSTHSMLDAESEYTRISSEQLYDLENERI
jgi:hypothetical protein